MKRLLGGLVGMLLVPMGVWAAPVEQMTVSPSCTSGTTIVCADETSRNTSISGTYNTHTHAGYTDISARVRNTAAIATTSGTATLMTFDSERWDTDTIHSTASNTSRLTATTAGKYQIEGHVEFQVNSGTGQRLLEVLLNGATILAAESCEERPVDRAVACTLSTHYNLVATDYVELRVTQRVQTTLNINASVNYSPEFEMVKVP